MSRTPDIRFKGFSGDWEITSLSKLSSLITKGTTPLDKRNIGPINFIKIEDIDSTNGKITPKSTISEKEHNGYLRRSQLKENDILFSIAGTLGRVTSIPAAILPANTNQALAIIRTNKGNLKYIVSALKGPVVDNYLRENPTIGAQPNLSLTQVSALEIPFPSDSEQQDIGRFFFILEKLISDSQSEVDRLRNLKKAMLQKMFPQKGSKVPEIRFKGFSGDWKLKKLSDVFDILQNNTLSRAELDMEAGAAINIHYGDVLINYGDCHDVASSCKQFIASEKTAAKYRSSWLRNGDVVMADTAEDEAAGKCTEINGVEELPVISGLHTIPLRPRQNFATGFLGYFMNSGSYHNQLIPYMHGTKVVSVSKGEIKETDIFYPGDIEEQRLIGKYFQDLDSLIEQRQSNTDRLRHLKQAMLQRMFI